MITLTTNDIGFEIRLPGEHKERSGFLIKRIGGKDNGKEFHLRGHKALEMFEAYLTQEGFYD